MAEWALLVINEFWRKNITVREFDENVLFHSILQLTVLWSKRSCVSCLSHLVKTIWIASALSQIA